MALISLNCYEAFSVLWSGRWSLCGEGSLVESFLWQRVGLPSGLPLLAVSAGRVLDSNYVITRKVDWFPPQDKMGSKVSQCHKVYR